MSDAPRTATAEQAELLLDVELRMLFSELMKAPRSATELGHHLKLSPQRVHYLLRKLLAADVAQLDSVTPRAGRAVKRYRVSPRWFIPFEVTGNDTLDDFLSAQILPRMDQLVRLSVRQLEAAFGTWGYWLEQEGESGSLRMGDPDGAAQELYASDEPFLLNLGTLRLSREQAAALKHKLIAVLDEFAALEERGEQPYTLGIQLVRGEIG
ncbi:winged helix-turn-helix domain-containing protein [Deinococcus sp.]|uniref:winged helix-turn-helix domain-containing protein n=1 Tax=Deinococcus sp. TaxID=47478 RepID=UPI0025F7DB23|nr:winged helix-turn-helix domain-containing protein [Deinococcus sp.]